MLALKRLPPKEAYDRVFRLRRAFQVCKPFYYYFNIWMDWQDKNKLLTWTNLKCSLAHQLLPKDQQTKPEEVRNYTNIPLPTASPLLPFENTPPPPSLHPPV